MSAPALQNLPPIEELRGLRLVKTMEEIKRLGEQMARRFADLGEIQEDLKEQGILVDFDLPVHVLTALSVWRLEQNRQAAEAERKAART